MDVRIIVETTFENGKTRTRRLGRLSRPFQSTQPEGFGLLLEDAKSILWQLQNAVLLDQIEEISEASRICPDCNRVKAIHDYRPRLLDTLFDRFHVKGPRIRRCACKAKSDVALGGPLSPLAHFFRTGRHLNCSAFKLNSGPDIPFEKQRISWKHFCHVQNRRSRRSEIASARPPRKSATLRMWHRLSRPQVAAQLRRHYFWMVRIFGVDQNSRSDILMLWLAKSRARKCAVASGLYSRRLNRHPGNYGMS